MQKNVAYQEAVMNHAFKDSQTRLLSLKTTQESAVDDIAKSHGMIASGAILSDILYIIK